MTPQVLQKTKDYIVFRDSSIDITAPSLDTHLGFLADRLSESVFGDVYYQAVGLYYLHINELNNSNSDSGSSLTGTVKKEKEDKLEVEVDTSASSLAGVDLARTGYGQELAYLSKERVSGKTFFNSRMAFIS